MKQPHFIKAVDAHGVSAQEATQAVKTLLRYIGEDPQREGLLGTPDRVCRAFLEMTTGYTSDPETLLATTFESNTDEMVVLKDIEYTSCCEHHLLTFIGKAHIGYLPAQGRIVGLSKLARVVDMYACRLQVQERMTHQIAHAIQKYLQPLGVAVVIEGTHSCMCVRGVKKQNPTMITSCMLGEFRSHAPTRHEFLSYIKK